jgi:hypothetical protein
MVRMPCIKKRLFGRNVADFESDTQLERNAKILHLPSPSQRQRANLSNWIEFTGSICRHETSFLEEPDLCTIVKPEDNGLSAIEKFVERFFVWSLSCFRRVSWYS